MSKQNEKPFQLVHRNEATSSLQSFDEEMNNNKDEEISRGKNVEIVDTNSLNGLNHKNSKDSSSRKRSSEYKIFTNKNKKKLKPTESRIQKIIKLVKPSNGQLLTDEQFEIFKLGKDHDESKSVTQNEIKNNQDFTIFEDWISVCETTGKLYCWSCLFFNTSVVALNSQGVSKRKEDTIRTLSHHSKTVSHIRARKLCEDYKNYQINPSESSRIVLENAAVLGPQETSNNDNTGSLKIISDIKKALRLPTLIYDNRVYDNRIYTNRIPPEVVAAIRRERPMPNIPQKDKSNSLLDFGVYQKYLWLAGCLKTHHVYCWPCILLTSERNVIWNVEELNVKVIMTKCDFIDNHTMKIYHLAAVALYAKIINILKVCNRDVQLRIVNGKNVEVVSHLELQQDKMFEPKYLETEKATMKNHNSIEKLLQMDPVLNTHIINKERLDVIKLGRPTPLVPNVKYMWIKVQDCYVKCANHFYSQYPWLSGSVKSQRLYCWYCVLFGLFTNDDTVGYQCVKGTVSFNHETLASHLDSVEMFRQVEDILMKNPDVQQLKIRGCNVEVDTSCNLNVDKIEYTLLLEDSNVQNYVLNLPHSSLQPTMELSDCMEQSDIIGELLENRFNLQISSHRLKLIQLGRPTPTMPKIRNPNYRVVQQTYKKISWLTGCPKRNKLYCWYCLLFSSVCQTALFCMNNNDATLHQLNMRANLHSYSGIHVKAQSLHDKVQEILADKRHSYVELSVNSQGEVLVLKCEPRVKLEAHKEMDLKTENTPPEPELELQTEFTPPEPELDIQTEFTPPEPELDLQTEFTPPEPGLILKTEFTPPEPELDLQTEFTPPEPELILKTEFTPPEPELELQTEFTPPESELDLQTEFTPPEPELLPIETEFTPPEPELLPIETELYPPETELVIIKIEFTPPEPELLPIETEFTPPESELVLKTEFTAPDKETNIMNQQVKPELQQKESVLHSEETCESGSRGSNLLSEHPTCPAEPNTPIEYLLQTPFVCRYSNVIKTRLAIVESGQPAFQLPDKHSLMAHVLGQLHTWLVTSNNRVYCWPCLLFNKRKNVWNDKGTIVMARLSRNAYNHSRTIRHIEAVDMYSSVKKLLQLNCRTKDIVRFVMNRSDSLDKYKY